MASSKPISNSSVCYAQDNIIPSKILSSLKYSSSSSVFLPGPVLTSPKVSHCGDSVTLFCPLPPKQTPIYQSLSALSITHHASHCMESSHPKAEQRNLLFLQLQILGNSRINWCFILSHINLVAEKHNGGWI